MILADARWPSETLFVGENANLPPGSDRPKIIVFSLTQNSLEQVFLHLSLVFMRQLGREACECDRLDIVKLFLGRRDFNIDDTDGHGRTGLMHAAKGGRVRRDLLYHRHSSSVCQKVWRFRWTL
ncbi:hypothetical protein GPALN_006681 [Globodera pallida]|nr:hypothetical protein GPALN_006681 [Globodera pallida]